MNKKILSFAFIIVISLSLLFTFNSENEQKNTEIQTSLQINNIKENNNKIIILHTNDIHSALDNYIGYAKLMTYKNQKEEEYGKENVLLVDAGDMAQGNAIASLTKGKASVELMNAVGYDYFVPGNHDFDYGMPTLFELIEELKAKTLATNIKKTKDNSLVFSPYDIKEINGIKIAFIGITTPETLIKSIPSFFQDKEGKYIYSFSEGKNGQELYAQVQETIDKVILEGADYIIALGHLGIEEISSPWRSIDLIENTEGIDVFIDGHSHSTINGEKYKNLLGEEVLLTQVSEKLKLIGEIIIDHKTDTITSKHIYNTDNMLEDDKEVHKIINSVNEEIAALTQEKKAITDFDLIRNCDFGILIYRQETNLANLITDAYRELLDADISIVNAGAIRDDFKKGEINYKEILDVNPFGSDVMSVLVSGEMLKNALEHGARHAPNESAGLLHVSGITYEIESAIPSSVVVDDKGNFIDVRGEYRVKNIKIHNKPIELDKKYLLASNSYILLNAGDGMTMFKDAEIVKNKYMLDSDALAHYLSINLKGIIPDIYANPDGQMRLKIYE